MDARRGACKHNKGTIAIRWQEDEKYRNSQQAHGWTGEYCRYLDYQTTIGISYTAPWHQRYRYESTITLVCNDGRQSGPMRARKDFKPTAKILASLRQEQGRQNSFIPKNERMRQRPFDEASRAELEWMSQNWKTCFSQPSSSSSSQQYGANTKTLNSMARSPMARSQVVERVKATDSLQTLRGSHFARLLRFRRFLHRFRVQTLANVVHATVSEDRTPRRTHIFPSLVSFPHRTRTFTRTCVWLKTQT